MIQVFFYFILYYFIFKESIGKINIWIANDMITKEVFQTVVKPENIINSVCVIVADLSRVIK